MMMKKNKGQFVVEMTMLIPILLGCIYLYVMFFLYFVQSAGFMCQIAQLLYQDYPTVEENIREIRIEKEGSTKVGNVEVMDQLFEFRLQLRKDEKDPVKNLRRWQLAADMF